MPALFNGVKYYLVLTLSAASKLVNDSKDYLIPDCMIVELPPILKT
jgi:hypothetical protein